MIEARWVDDGSVFSAAAARRLGAEPSHLRRAVAAGQLTRVRRDAYVDATAWASLHPADRYRQLVAAAARGLRDPVMSHRSAAVVWGLPLLGDWPTTVQVTAPGAAGGRSQPGIERHCVSGPVARAAVDGLVVTSLARTVVDLARTESFACGLMAADAALGGRHRAADEPASTLTGGRPPVGADRPGREPVVAADRPGGEPVVAADRPGGQPSIGADRACGLLPDWADPADGSLPERANRGRRAVPKRADRTGRRLVVAAGPGARGESPAAHRDALGAPGGGDPLLAELIDELETAGRGRGARAARRVLMHASGLAESAGESLSRARMVELGAPAPVLQHTFTVRGRVIRVDFW